MDLEALGMCTIGWYRERYASLISEELSRLVYDRWKPMGRQAATWEKIETMYQEFLDGVRQGAYRRHEERVIRWGQWWSDTKGGSTLMLVSDLLQRIEAGTCECSIARAYEEALAEDSARAFEWFIADENEMSEVAA
jgi:hypothetical protein